MTAAAFTVAQVTVLAVAIFVSALVTAVAGFGFALMSVPLMSLAVDLHSTVIVSSLVGVVGNAVQTWLYRNSRDQALAKRLGIAAITGVPFGYLIYDLVSDTALRVVLFGGVVLAVAALARGINLTHVGPSMDWMMGFASGVLGTSISTSGPPLVFDLQSRRLGPEAFRGTINYVFLVSGCVGLGVFTAGGKIERHDLFAAAIAVPALFAGLAAGFPLRKAFPPERFRVLVLVLLVVSATAALVKAFV